MRKSKENKQIALQSLKGNWGVAIVTVLLFSVALAVLSMVPFATIILIGVLSVGLCHFFINLIRKEKAEFSNLAYCFKGEYFMQPMFAGILVNLYTILWSMLLVIPGIIKSYSYSMTYFILRENPTMSANEAITRSREIMNGNKWKLFCLHFSFIGWYILSAFTLGIGLLFLAPYVKASEAAFYDSINPDIITSTENAGDEEEVIAINEVN